MRGKLVHSFRWALSALALGACGQAEVPEVDGVAQLGESAQAVLYPPPAPASGNIVDSTTFLGPVTLGGSVQAQFTANPQYFSFAFQAQAGAQVRLEVTHLGSSMYLDTGLFVYGPRLASGSWGTNMVVLDDDSGYGQLSKLAAVSLPQAGEYLAVVSSGSGVGKRFRLQLDCINGTCGPLALGSLPLSSGLAAAMAAGNARCDTGENWCDGTLHTYTVQGPQLLDPVALAAAQASLGELFDYHRFERWPNTESWAEFLDHHGSWWLELQQVLPAELASGAIPQVAHYYASYAVAPGAKDYHHVYVFYFPQTNRVAVLQHITHEI
ncbi:hypothetical protein [Pyxidicoccus xibeiensis]|uniref:hypothetical protein n=1 Tax=Pyxidicoccus xibeiensis TaxID=2906759 RepID=UPI0020A831C0|nr:hypothetical protein [Pyxidicoccus xibeiensis]MCP3137032.1 hypothetical protein [Pyxidicoccus xibeiensis]